MCLDLYLSVGENDSGTQRLMKDVLSISVTTSLFDTSSSQFVCYIHFCMIPFCLIQMDGFSFSILKDCTSYVSFRQTIYRLL